MNRIETSESLPKLTKLKKNEINKKIDSLFALQQINYKDMEDLGKDGLARFDEFVNKKANELKGEAAEKFWHQIEPIILEDTKNQLWESNHNQITYAISTLMQDFGRMPSNTEIATKTELSRQTVHKHMKNYMEHPLYKEQQERYRFMKDKVLAKVFNFAVQGDVKAARLFFEMTGALQTAGNNNTYIKNQNNIQINNTVLNQEKLKSLSKAQLDQIEMILQGREIPLFPDVVEE